MLTADETNRYARQLGIPGWGEEAQELLRKARVFVAGAGGLGGPLLFYLASAGVGTIRVCDCDRVELSNLNRQILHHQDSIAAMKADSAYATLHRYNPSIAIHPLYDRITGANAETLIDDADVIVDCLDNFETRHVLNRAAVRRSLPLAHAGVAGFQGQITFIQPPDTPCLGCFLPLQGEKEKVPIVGATAGVLGSLLAAEVIKHLTGIGASLRNRILFWDGLGMRFDSIAIRKNPRCAVCAD